MEQIRSWLLKNNFVKNSTIPVWNGAVVIYTLLYLHKYDFEKNHVYNLEKIRYIIEKCLSSDEILITKKTKKGIEKTINYRNSLKSFEIKDEKTGKIFNPYVNKS